MLRIYDIKFHSDILLFRKIKLNYKIFFDQWLWLNGLLKLSLSFVNTYICISTNLWWQNIIHPYTFFWFWIFVDWISSTSLSLSFLNFSSLETHSVPSSRLAILLVEGETCQKLDCTVDALYNPDHWHLVVMSWWWQTQTRMWRREVKPSEVTLIMLGLAQWEYLYWRCWHLENLNLF